MRSVEFGQKAIPSTMGRIGRLSLCGLLATATFTFLGCSCTVRVESTGETGTEDGPLRGTIQIDGSSTVEPISSAAAEEFSRRHPRVRTLVGTSGTGGGFDRFVLGEIDINDASRPIKPREVEACRRNGVEFLELKIATDGLSVVTNSRNDWVDCLTVDQLRSIWQRGSTIQRWSDVNPDWPNAPIKLYGPDPDSGTFDYFTETINGESGNIRTDYQPSANDNVLVQGVAGDLYSLGYFGYAYYAENRGQLKVIGVSPTGDKADCVKPTDESIESGAYTPLSRPLFLYVNKRSLGRREVVAFLQFYLDEGQDLVEEVGYVRLGADTLAEMKVALNEAIREQTGQEPETTQQETGGREAEAQE